MNMPVLYIDMHISLHNCIGILRIYCKDVMLMLSGFQYVCPSK